MVEDNESIRFGMVRALRLAGYATLEAISCAGLLTAVEQHRPDVLVTDLRLPDGECVDVLAQVRAIDRSLPVFVVTGHASIDAAVLAVKAGAQDFLTKPVEMDRLLRLVDEAAKPRVRRRSNPNLGAESPALADLNVKLAQVRDADCPILILGETGTGKTLLARTIHDTSQRAKAPFIAINCAGLSAEFVESELFGHARGAFTGAHADRQGLFEAAHGGTLFLDEIGDVDLVVQPKILKVVEEKRFRRMGEVKERLADVRLIAATNRDLLAASRERSFRSDLYYRISTMTLTLPPLRARQDDLAKLAAELLADSGLELAPDALDKLRAHDWPGNVRELRNVLERARLACSGSVLEAHHIALDAAPAAEAPRPTLDARRIPTRSELEREHIRMALDASNGNVDLAAKQLGMPRSTLYLRIRLHGLSTARKREA